MAKFGISWYLCTPMTTTLIIGLLIPLLGTMLGSAFVFMMRDEMSVRLQKSLLGIMGSVLLIIFEVSK